MRAIKLQKKITGNTQNLAKCFLSLLNYKDISAKSIVPTVF